MKAKFTLILFLIFFLSQITKGQELKVFTTADFDLKGNVKSCLIFTGYGKELLEFNEVGMLTKTTIHFNDSDQEITNYRYQDSILIEKRIENYKNKLLDEATSMVNFYEVDTTATRRIFEKIVSYDKAFAEQSEYIYNSNGDLASIITSNRNGVDEVKLTYQEENEQLTKSVYRNEVIHKSTRTSYTIEGEEKFRIELDKEFIDGEPNIATEVVFNDEGVKLSEELFRYSNSEEEFESFEKHNYIYDENGVLIKENIRKENTNLSKEFIFQFDNNHEQNWVKRIVTPENSYMTRRITYYPTMEEEKEE